MDAKKVLVAVDASENSERAVVYVGEMLSGAKGFRVELLCVDRPPLKDLFPNEETWRTACQAQAMLLAEFLDKARGILLAKGFDPASVGGRCVSADGPSLATAILEVQQKGGFGTVVVGRRGVSKAEEFLFGSVSSRVVHHAKGCTVWVVG